MRRRLGRCSPKLRLCGPCRSRPRSHSLRARKSTTGAEHVPQQRWACCAAAVGGAPRRCCMLAARLCMVPPCMLSFWRHGSAATRAWSPTICTSNVGRHTQYCPSLWITAEQPHADPEHLITLCRWPTWQSAWPTASSCWAWTFCRRAPTSPPSWTPRRTRCRGTAADARLCAGAAAAAPATH